MKPNMRKSFSLGYVWNPKSFEEKNREANREDKRKEKIWRKIENKFKFNKLILHVYSSLFYFFLSII